ncbi:hypothetical protein ACROYT_G014286 [Oculina patagonica]
MQELYEEHSGIVAMKSIAGSYIWRPNLDAEIELMVKSCEVCQAVRKAPPSAPLYPWRWPTRVWQRVHIDFAEKDGNYFLGLIDSHSKWLEVAHMRSTTAQSTIDQMRLWFANGVKQTLVPPYHPSANGAAERTVQILKQALLKHAESVRRGGKKRALKHQLVNRLFQYRNTPRSVTGVTPSELLLRRKLRNKFSVLLPNMEDHIQDQQGKQQRQHDKSRVKMQELSPRDSVNVRSTQGEVEKWTQRLNAEEAFDEVDPEELPAFMAEPVAVPRTPLPSPSTSVPATTLEQPAEIPDPIAHPVPESPTRQSPAAPEIVSKSPVKIPVAVSEAEPPSPMQHQSETVPRNSPVRAKRRYPARERKAPDRLNL